LDINPTENDLETTTTMGHFRQVTFNLVYYPRILNTELTKNMIKCIWCSNAMGFRFKPMAQWNLAEDGYLYGDCYEKKLAEYYLSPERRNLTKQSDRKA